MNLRLTDEQHEALRAQAGSEGVSMQDVVRRAIDRYLLEARRARLDAIVDSQLSRYAEVFDRLGK